VHQRAKKIYGSVNTAPECRSESNFATNAPACGYNNFAINENFHGKQK